MNSDSYNIQLEELSKFIEKCRAQYRFVTHSILNMGKQQICEIQDSNIW